MAAFKYVQAFFPKAKVKVRNFFLQAKVRTVVVIEPQVKKISNALNFYQAQQGMKNLRVFHCLFLAVSLKGFLGNSKADN